MRTTFVALVGLCAAALAMGCEDEKKPTESTASSATAAPASASAAVAPAPPKASPSELAVKTINAAAGAWNSHDPSKVAALFAPTGKLMEPGMPEVSGHDALAADAKNLFTEYPDFKVAVTRTFVKGNTAIYEWNVTGKNDGPQPNGQKATGRSVGITGASLAVFNDDGLIKEEHRYFDVVTLQSQLDPKAKAGSFRAPAPLPTAANEVHVSKGTPDEAKTIEQGDAIIKADQLKDDKALMATVADDYVWQDNSSPTPITPANLKQMQGNYNKAFPDWTMTMTTKIGVDGFYAVEIDFAGTQKGPMGPVKASNKPVKSKFIDIQQINKDGKATKEWSYMNSADLMVQIGAMPPMAPPAASGAPAGTAVAAGAPTTTAAKPK